MIEGREKYARLAAQLLMDEYSELAPPQADTRRDAVVAAMALAIAAKARRRRMITGITAGLAAAASLALVAWFAGFGRTSGSDAALLVADEAGQGNVLVHAGATQSLLGGGAIQVGDSVRSDGAGHATLAFRNGTRVALAAATDLHVDELGPVRRFSLRGGRVEAHVRKLVQGERFIIDTPDSEIEVHGTVFTVEVDTSLPGCGAGGTSTVDVSEGEVSVRSGTGRVFVHPGERWTVPCTDRIVPDKTEPTAAPLAPAAPSVRATIHHGGKVTRTAPITKAVASPPPLPVVAAAPSVVPAPASQLSQQNDLMSAAMAAERQGQHDVALRKLNELITRFPGGPLMESARAQRQRILAAPPPR
jgi:hypothetical protein